MRDPYLYSDSEVLKNLADIHDADMLKNMEADYTSFRLSEIVMDDTEREYDFETLCNMHYHIFQDVYKWAGKPRVINIEKAEKLLRFVVCLLKRGEFILKAIYSKITLLICVQH